MRADGLETAVVMTVGVAALEAIHRVSDETFAGRGVPPHVTLLYPFVPINELESALPLLQAVVGRQERFTFELSKLSTFPRTIWLAPEPAAPFVALTKAIEAAFPKYPHFEGEFAEVIPHLTLVDGLDAAELGPTLARLRALVEPLLPLKVAADQATVLAERPSGRWVPAAQLPLRRVG